MEKITFSVSFLLCFINIINAQVAENDPIDPFLGNYILGNNAEVVIGISSSKGKGANIFGQFDFDKDNKILPNALDWPTDPNTIPNQKNLDIIAGDFNGDNKDEYITAYESKNHSITLICSDRKNGKLNLKTNNFVLDSVLQDQLRLITGNFDLDPKKEFILSYRGLDEKLHFELYEVDKWGDLKVIAQKKSINLEASSLYDMTSDDFDGDGLDEIVIVNPNKAENKKGELYSRVYVFDYDCNDGLFELNASETISSGATAMPFDISSPLHVKGIAICVGDFDNDGIKNEIAYSWELSDYNYVDWIFVSTTFKDYQFSYFKVNKNLKSLETPNKKTIYIRRRWFEDAKNLVNFFSLAINTADFNGDGIYEIITYTPNDLNIFQFSGGTFNAIAHFSVMAKTFFNSHRILALADIDADTTGETKNWVPEVLLLQITSGKLFLTAYKAEVDSNKTIKKIYEFARRDLEAFQDEFSSCALALGDFDGDGLRLGTPNKIVKQKIFVPNIIMAAPPIHYDILAGKTSNLNYISSETKPIVYNYFTQYCKETSTRESFSSTKINNWGVSLNASKGIGNKTNSVLFTASIDVAFKQNNQEKIDTTAKIAVTSTVSAQYDDRVHGVTTDFYLFEYPLFFKGDSIGSVLASIPRTDQYTNGNTWIDSKSLDFTYFTPRHEYGNLLSYAPSISDFPDLNSIDKRFTYESQGIGSNGFGPVIFSNEMIKKKLTETSKEVNVGISMGYGSIFSSGKIKGDFSHKKISSFLSEFTTNLDIIVDYRRPLFDMYQSEAYFKITPCIYWATSGELIIDYAVDLTGKWWQDNYGTKPDPAFIMPYRYDPEKINNYNTSQSKRSLTSDIRYLPYDAFPGDSITVTATIRNFCLNNTLNTVKVNFYHGDPDNKGKFIKSINYGPIVPRGNDTKSFKWKAPSSVEDQPWIFAVIDPDKEIDEIHEEYNKGWIPLFGSTKFPEDVPSGTKKSQGNMNFDLNVYPNPTNSFATIKIALSNPEQVKVELFSLTGVKICEIVHQPYPSGEHMIRFDVSKLNNGIYFLKTSFGQNIKNEKISILR